MGRPYKTGLDYFPLDTGFISDRKIQRLLVKHGCNGLSVYLLLIGEIYGSNGYYIPHGGELFFDLGFSLRLKEDEVEAIIGYCVELDLFDADLLEKRHIYTSYGIQCRYHLVSSRCRMQMDSRYLTVKMQEVLATEKGVSATETGVFAAETPVRATKTPVRAAKTPANRNINKKINKNKREIIKEIENEEQKKNQRIDYEGSFGSADARKAELQRLLDAATGRRDA